MEANKTYWNYGFDKDCACINHQIIILKIEGKTITYQEPGEKPKRTEYGILRDQIKKGSEQRISKIQYCVKMGWVKGEQKIAWLNEIPELEKIIKEISLKIQLDIQTFNTFT